MVFWLIYGGCWTHILMDMLQIHLLGGYMWFYPFSLKTFSFGFTGPEAFLNFLWLTIPLNLLAFFLAWRKRGGNRLKAEGKAFLRQDAKEQSR